MPFSADTDLGDPKCSQFTSVKLFSSDPIQSSNASFSSELSSVPSFWDIITNNHKPNSIFSNSCKILLSSTEFHYCNSLGLVEHLLVMQESNRLHYAE